VNNALVVKEETLANYNIVLSKIKTTG